MKVCELIDLLKGLDGNNEVCLLPSNSHFPEGIKGRAEENVAVRTYWGKDREVTLLYGNGQIGGIQ